MKANILRIFSSFLRYNKHAKLFVQRWHHFWSSKIDHYFTKQRISIKMLLFYLCVRSVILGFIKILTELFVQLFLKRRGKTIPRKNYLHWVFFSKQEEQWLSKYFFIYQTPADFISHEEYVMWKCFVYCKILSLFILLIHLYYVRLFFTFILLK